MAEDFAAAAAQIAREAGALLRSYLGKVVVEYKGEADLVTAADRDSELLILRRLRERYPAHGVIAEEGGRERAQGGYCWYVDPLDGTTNFAHRLPFFAVSMGLALEGEMVAAAVYNPMLDEMFTATRGGGAALNDSPITVTSTTRLADALLATGFPSRKRHANPNIHFYHALTLRSQGVRRLGSAALDLCYVAAGRFDGFWEFNLHPWDIAAGVLLVTEAGGAVSDMLGRPHQLNAPEILASNGRLQATLVGQFGELFAGRTAELPSAPAYLETRPA